MLAGFEERKVSDPFGIAFLNFWVFEVWFITFVVSVIGDVILLSLLPSFLGRWAVLLNGDALNLGCSNFGDTLLLTESILDFLVSLIEG